MKTTPYNPNIYGVTHLGDPTRTAAHSSRRMSLCGRDVRPEQIADEAECGTCRFVASCRTAGRAWAAVSA